ncbi:hypothetical protein P7L75_00915 (plasmid) [Tistrella mobilis]|uniref:DUF6603 domain-containing protein n=1 Tax=Tistrella mobilis TaxID=171437 RepID=UPI003556C871
MATDVTIDELHDHVQGLINEGSSLEWDYLSESLGLGKPPGSPPAIDHFRPKTVSLTRNPLCLQVALETPYGDGVLLFYRGTFGPASGQDSEGWRLYAGLKVGARATLDDIPMGGPVDPGSLAIRGIQLLVTTHDVTAAEAKAIYTALVHKPPTHELSGTDYDKLPTPPLDGLTTRLTFRADVQVMTANYGLLVEVGKSSESGAAGSKSPAAATVNKQVGGLRVNRLFGLYDDVGSRFGIGIDAVIGLGGGITLSLIDLTFGIHIGTETETPVFGLKGAEVGGKIAGATLGGGLYIDDLTIPSLWGELMFNLPSFGVAVMGGYSRVDGQTSFFGFGFLRVPVGGPPFLDIEGVALGGAYNRDLVVPEADKLDKFPFIQAAMSFAHPSSQEFSNPFPSDVTDPKSLVNTLEVLGTKTAPPTAGRHWGTFGLAFSSFKIFKGFVLISAVFGSATRVSLVGEAMLVMPPQEPEAIKPQVMIDMFLRMVIDITSGIFALDAYVKHNSYLVEPNMQLTGGFALRIWYGGAHAGQGVITLGGYSPHVDLSAFDYYPTVPRLAMSMVMTGGMQVDGTAYAAVTLSMAMLGLAFRVSGKWGPGSVWATVAFDALYAWEPVHYSVYVSLEFGVSVSVKVWFVHVTMTFHVGASAHLWGPPLSGEARLDLSVCTISWHIGANAPTPTPLSWSDFETRYLKAPGNEVGDTQTRAVSDIQVTGLNMLQPPRSRAEDAKWVVDPEAVTIRTTTEIPTKAWSASLLGRPSSGAAANQAFGVRPCDIANDRFHTTHSLTIDGEAGDLFVAVPRTGSVPAALWGTGDLPAVGPGTIVGDVVVGFDVTIDHPKPDRTQAADAEHLLVTTYAYHLHRIAANTDHAGDLDGQPVSGSIASDRAMANRQRIFSALSGYLTPAEDPGIQAGEVDVQGFANGQDDDLFISPPRRRLLGEDRA